MLNVETNEYITSISRTVHSKLKESPVAGSCKRIELADGFLLIVE